jgi:sulfite reductase (ferredoxin)
MQFGVKQAEQTVLSGESTAHAAPKVTLSKDFRGIACPMNFVKTKMALSQINKGETLQVILDDGAPIENVPKSVEEEGHTILSTLKSENHWVVSIRKKQ